MKFKAPENNGGVSVRGMSFDVKDGIIDIDIDLTPQEIEALQSFGVVPAPVVEATAEMAPVQSADADEKAGLIAELQSLGVKADGRKTVASLRAMLEQAKSAA
jgi:hypothetical protein